MQLDRLVRIQKGGGMRQWQLQDAKARLSELVKLCAETGPQILTVRGKEEAILISVADYKKLTGRKPEFISFIKSSPIKGVDLELSRDKSLPRDLEL